MAAAANQHLEEARALNQIAAEVGIISSSSAANEAVARQANTSSTAKSGDGGVRELTLSEWKEAGATLAKAFESDQSSMYFTHTPDRAHWSKEQKWDLHVKMMEYITYAHLLKGKVVCAGPNYDCVALWMPPGKNMDDIWTILRSGMWRLYYQLSREGWKRFFNEFLPLLGDTKAAVLEELDQDSYYLVYIGTKPGSQGKGYARKAIDYVTKTADEEGKACYLESSHEVNRKIYGKMGFQLKKEIYLQRAKEGNVSLDIMVRDPVTKVRETDADSGIVL